MKLLFFIHSLSCGGAERVTANLANYWAARGWVITVVTLSPSDQDFYHLHPTVIRIALNLDGESDGVLSALRNNLRRLRVLRRVLIQQKPDVALAMMSMANILLAMASVGLKGFKKFGSERIHPPRLPLGRLWERMRVYWYGRLDAIVALSSESAEWIQTHTSAKNISVIPNPVVWPLQVNTPVLLPESAGIPLRKRLLAVGRLEPQKGFDLLIDVFARLAPSHTEWELVILGEGSLHTELQARIDALQLAGRILLPGRVGNLAEWYTQADLYVMSSLFEGFPNTLVEAMAYGLPAVSSDCDTGPRDIIRYEIDGLLVPPGDADALAAAMDRLMGDEYLRKQYAERAVEARERFSMERIAGIWEELFIHGN